MKTICEEKEATQVLKQLYNRGIRDRTIRLTVRHAEDSPVVQEAPTTQGSD